MDVQGDIWSDPACDSSHLLVPHVYSNYLRFQPDFRRAGATAVSVTFWKCVCVNCLLPIEPVHACSNPACRYISSAVNCIREVLRSNLDWDISYFNRSYSWFASVLFEKLLPRFSLCNISIIFRKSFREFTICQLQRALAALWNIPLQNYIGEVVMFGALMAVTLKWNWRLSACQGKPSFHIDGRKVP
jgi:hypothetical protein